MQFFKQKQGKKCYIQMNHKNIGSHNTTMVRNIKETLTMLQICGYFAKHIIIAFFLIFTMYLRKNKKRFIQMSNRNSRFKKLRKAKKGSHI